jgi:hypothetical protein
MSSAAASISLIAASLVLVVGVSAIIAVRGFHGVNGASPAQSVTLSAPAAAHEAGGAPVVIGSAKPHRRKATRARTPAAAAPAASGTKAARTQSKPSRSGLSAPAAKRPSGSGEVGEDAPVASSEPAEPATVPEPVEDVLDQVTGVVEEAKPAEKVGDTLLDLRDALP